MSNKSLIYPPKTFSQPYLNSTTLENKRVVRPHNLVQKICDANSGNPMIQDIRIDQKLLDELTKLPEATAVSPINKKQLDMTIPERAFTLLSTPIREDSFSFDVKSSSSASSLNNTSPRTSSSSTTSRGIERSPRDTTRSQAYMKSRKPKLPDEIVQCLEKMATIKASNKKIATPEMLATMQELENIVASKQHLLDRLVKDENKLQQLMSMLSEIVEKKKSTLQEEKTKVFSAVNEDRRR